MVVLSLLGGENNIANTSSCPDTRFLDDSAKVKQFLMVGLPPCSTLPAEAIGAELLVSASLEP